MNNNIDLAKILKDCKGGIKLYCTLLGEVEFIYIEDDCAQIVVCDKYADEYKFTKEGKYYDVEDGECLLFPSKNQRDWSNFKTSWLNNQKFDSKTLQPFDKVLVRTNNKCTWDPDFFGYIDHNRFMCVATGYVQCIPYNDDTKHLLGTTEEAPEFYRYWEVMG